MNADAKSKAYKALVKLMGNPDTENACPGCQVFPGFNHSIGCPIASEPNDLWLGFSVEKAIAQVIEPEDADAYTDEEDDDGAPQAPPSDKATWVENGMDGECPECGYESGFHDDDGTCGGDPTDIADGGLDGFKINVYAPDPGCYKGQQGEWQVWLNSQGGNYDLCVATATTRVGALQHAMAMLEEAYSTIRTAIQAHDKLKETL